MAASMLDLIIETVLIVGLLGEFHGRLGGNPDQRYPLITITVAFARSIPKWVR